MSTNRQQVTACARTFLGTPFRHAGRSKGLRGGLDCVGLPLMIAGELGLCDTAGLPLTGDTYKAYTPQPVNNIVLDLCAQHLQRVAMQDRQEGDVLVMKIPNSPCHVGIYAGIVNEQPTLIHAYSGADGVVEHGIDTKWARRIVAAFRFPGVE